ncbi:MAG: cbb3-type cytochrome c oxidase subunit 3 [Leptospiraceae bacterium]|nr:cbb3-type cytochrome c oxidase subunit 3 [Leptospiraceae bacterium]
MENEIWWGIYKGLRMPLLGMILLFIAWYVYRPSKRKELEKPKYDMLDDDIDTNLSDEYRNQNKEAV